MEHQTLMFHKRSDKKGISGILLVKCCSVQSKNVPMLIIEVLIGHATETHQLKCTG